MNMENKIGWKTPIPFENIKQCFGNDYLARHFYINCLLEARREDMKEHDLFNGKPYILMRGQVLLSRREWAKSLNCSPSTIQKLIQRLEVTGEDDNQIKEESSKKGLDCTTQKTTRKYGIEKVVVNHNYTIISINHFNEIISFQNQQNNHPDSVTDEQPNDSDYTAHSQTTISTNSASDQPIYNELKESKTERRKDGEEGEMVKKREGGVINSGISSIVKTQAEINQNPQIFETPDRVSGPTSQEILNIQSVWNHFAEENGLSTVIKLTPARVNAIKARAKEPLFDLQQVFEKIRNSKFLLGIKSTWKADFDFVFRSETNYLKILEGNYDDSVNPTRLEDTMKSFLENHQEEDE